MKTITVGHVDHLYPEDEITIYEKKPGKRKKTNLNKGVVAIQKVFWQPTTGFGLFLNVARQN